MKRILVRASSRTYPVLIGQNLLRSLGNFLKPLGLGRKILVVTNRRVGRHYLSPVRSALERGGFDVAHHFLPNGNERDKSEQVLSKLWAAMAKIPLERTSTVVALGGGVVGDVSAFAASTYMRGISLVQVPTTLLAQVDSAIGGKTAIDLPAAKNIVGTFYQPKLVVSDIETLKTTSEEDMRNSFAEVIKYGVIRDTKLFELLERRVGPFFLAVHRKSLSDRDLSFLETIVCRSVRVKADVVGRDEFETKGERMILNYGHTFGHALEACTRFKLPHGEAVAYGMMLAARMARRNGGLSRRDEARQQNLIESVGLPTEWAGKRPSGDQIISFMKKDKKVRDGKLRLVLPKSIGRVEVREGISEHQIRSVLSTW